MRTFFILRGVEVDVTWQALKSLRVRHSATYSYNRIRSWTQFYDIYDAEGAWAGTTSLTHENVVPLLTPAVLLNLGAEYSPVGWCTVGAAGRYVGAAHLDNTNSADFEAPGFFGLDADLSISLASLVPFAAGAAPRLRVQAPTCSTIAACSPAATATSTSSWMAGARCRPPAPATTTRWRRGACSRCWN
jgi:hypothetical protein